MTFVRGYKSWCERYAAEIRKTLNLAPHAPFDPWALARHLNIRVRTPEQIPGISRESLSVLARSDGTPSCWSAVTIMVNEKVLVILNSAHSAARQASDLAHELAHRIRQHAAQEVNISQDGMVMLKDYDKLQEEEADWLAGCLLLPREALLHIKGQAMNVDAAALNYGVSSKMLNYRMSVTGVNRQFGYRM